MQHTKEGSNMMSGRQDLLHNLQNGNTGPLVHKLSTISTQLQQSVKSNNPCKRRVPCKGTGCMSIKPDLLGTVNASALLEQEVPGAEVLYEAGNDTGEISRGQIVC